MVGVFTLIVVGGLVGFRTVQRNRGFNLLIQRGLNTEEARAHMAKVAQQNKVGLFATAEDHAGLEVGADVVSAEERKAAQAQAEMDAIYGTAATVDPNAGFAPAAYNPPALSRASSQAAAEAAALLSDDDDAMTGGDPLESIVEDIAGAAAVAVPAPSVPQEPVAEPSLSVALPPEVEHSGTASVDPSVALPETPSNVSQPTPAVPPVPPASTAVRHTCTSCSAVFEIDMPAGVSKAVVACPSCGVDQTVALNL